jgi:DNA helicase-2/ATP-dependent DNA helicase PcrA
MTRAMEHLSITWAQSRQVFGQRRLAEPSRFLSEIPRDRVEATGGGRAAAGTLPFRHPRPAAAYDRGPVAAPFDAAPLSSIRPGARVRHPLFGVGTVLRSEGAGDDLKLTVSFAGVGAKRLVARYAGLEVV